MIKTHSVQKSSILRSVCLSAVTIAAVVSLSACNSFPSIIKKQTTTAAAETTTTAVTTTTATSTTTTTAIAGFPTYGWCNATTLTVRSGPSTDYNGIGGLAYGEKIQVLGQEGDWFKIKFKDGEAYVSAAFIQFKVVETTTASAGTTAAITTTASSAQ